MSDKNKKYPKVIVGAFILNDKDELFLTRGVKWHNKYVCPGGRVEAGEKVEEALKREIKEETNLDIKDVKFIGVIDGYNINDSYSQEDNHLIFLDYQARARNTDRIKINDEATSYKWMSVDKWLAKDRKEFAPYTYEVIEKIRDNKENFEYKYKRALADYQNLLKRTAEEKAEFAKYANENMIREILPVYDNLKLALTHIDESADSTGNNNINIIAGIKYVVKQFKDELEKLGIEEIKVKAGDKFDHNIMEALAPAAEPGQEIKGEKVKQVVKAGYRLYGKLMIPAKVVVGD